MIKCISKNYIEVYKNAFQERRVESPKQKNTNEFCKTVGYYGKEWNYDISIINKKKNFQKKKD